MSNVRTIVENIVNDKFENLKEDLSKAVSAKAVNVLESKKAMIGKKFLSKEEIKEEPLGERIQIGRVPVAGRDPEEVRRDIEKMRQGHKDIRKIRRGPRPTTKGLDPSAGPLQVIPRRRMDPTPENTRYIAVYGNPGKPKN